MLFAPAFEMSAFSKAFKAELYNAKPLTAPVNSKLSRRVYVMGQAVLNGIELARSTLKHHEIKLLRGLAVTVKTAFMKLLQDYEGTRGCDDCEFDMKVNNEDQKHLMTLLQFIMHGLAPLDKKPEKLRDALKFFDQTNTRAIEDRVQAYLARDA